MILPPIPKTIIIRQISLHACRFSSPAPTFKFLPEFRNLQKKEEHTVHVVNSNKTFTNKGNFVIVKKPEIELVEFLSETTFINDEFKTLFVNNLLRSIRITGDVEYFPNITKYVRRKFVGRDFRSSQELPLDEIPETLSILRKYKKFQVDSRKLNTKNFFGSYLTNFRNSHKFYFAPAKSNKMSIYSISTKYGNYEDYEYLISPNKLPVTITSNCFGSLTNCIAALSTSI